MTIFQFLIPFIPVLLFSCPFFNNFFTKGMLFKSDTLSRIYTKSGTEILLFRFSRLWYALVSKQQYNNPRHMVHTVFQCFGYHEFTRFRKTKTFSGAKVLLFSDICKRKGLFYIFCGHFRQINTSKAAEAALNFSLVPKKYSPNMA